MSLSPNLCTHAPDAPYLALGASVIQKAIIDLENKDPEIVVDALLWLAGPGEDFAVWVLDWDDPDGDPLLASIVRKKMANPQKLNPKLAQTLSNLAPRERRIFCDLLAGGAWINSLAQEARELVKARESSLKKPVGRPRSGVSANMGHK